MSQFSCVTLCDSNDWLLSKVQHNKRYTEIVKCFLNFRTCSVKISLSSIVLKKVLWDGDVENSAIKFCAFEDGI